MPKLLLRRASVDVPWLASRFRESKACPSAHRTPTDGPHRMHQRVSSLSLSSLSYPATQIRLHQPSSPSPFFCTNNPAYPALLLPGLAFNVHHAPPHVHAGYKSTSHLVIPPAPAKPTGEAAAAELAASP